MLSRLKKERRSRREAPLPRKPFCLVPEMRPAVQKVVQILPALLRGSPPSCSCSGPAHCAIAARIQGNLVARVEWLKTGVGTGFTGVCVCVGNKVFIASAVTVTEPSLLPHVVLLYFLRLPPWGGRRRASTNALSPQICPICAALPGGDPNHVTDDFTAHLTLEHRAPRDLISFPAPRVRPCTLSLHVVRGP